MWSCDYDEAIDHYVGELGFTLVELGFTLVEDRQLAAEAFGSPE